MFLTSHNQKSNKVDINITYTTEETCSILVHWRIRIIKKISETTLAANKGKNSMWMIASQEMVKYKNSVHLMLYKSILISHNINPPIVCNCRDTDACKVH